MGCAWPSACRQPIKAGAHHQFDDLGIGVLAALLQKAHHRVAGAGVQGVEHRRAAVRCRCCRRPVLRQSRRRSGRSRRPGRRGSLGGPSAPRAAWSAAGQQGAWRWPSTVQRFQRSSACSFASGGISVGRLMVDTHLHQYLHHGGAAQLLFAAKVLVKTGFGNAHGIGHQSMVIASKAFSPRSWQVARRMASSRTWCICSWQD